MFRVRIPEPFCISQFVRRGLGVALTIRTQAEKAKVLHISPPPPPPPPNSKFTLFARLKGTLRPPAPRPVDAACAAPAPLPPEAPKPFERLERPPLVSNSKRGEYMDLIGDLPFISEVGPGYNLSLFGFEDAFSARLSDALPHLDHHRAAKKNDDGSIPTYPHLP